jgi:hypothetical protein
MNPSADHIAALTEYITVAFTVAHAPAVMMHFRGITQAHGILACYKAPSRIITVTFCPDQDSTTVKRLISEAFTELEQKGLRVEVFEAPRGAP